jgi:hypothetical protein
MTSAHFFTCRCRHPYQRPHPPRLPNRVITAMLRIKTFSPVRWCCLNVPGERRTARARPTDGGTRVPANNQTLRPNKGRDYTERGRTHPVVKFVSDSALRADPPPRVLALLRILLLRAFSFEHGLDFKCLGATDLWRLALESARR